MAKRVVIIGALSAVAIAVARLYATQGATLALAARRDDELQTLAKDLVVRGAADARIFPMDLASAETAPALTDMVATLGGVDVVLIAYGALTEQAKAETDLDYAAHQLQTNYVSAALWSLATASIIRNQDSGVLVVIGSVAGDRGRQSNYVYGSAKAGLGTLVQGIAHSLAKSHGRAVLVKPGFIDTPMTAHLPKGGPLWAKPETIAEIIVRTADSGGPIVYAPWFWKYILLIIRLVPSAIFHRTKL